MNGGPPIRELYKDLLVWVGTDLLVGGIAVFAAFCHNNRPDIKGMVTGTVTTVLGSASFTIGNNRVEQRLAEADSHQELPTAAELETNQIVGHLAVASETGSS
jgi:uncharacterized membrane protein